MAHRWPCPCRSHSNRPKCVEWAGGLSVSSGATRARGKMRMGSLRGRLAGRIAHSPRAVQSGLRPASAVAGPRRERRTLRCGEQRRASGFLTTLTAGVLRATRVVHACLVSRSLTPVFVSARGPAARFSLHAELDPASQRAYRLPRVCRNCDNCMEFLPCSRLY